MYKKLLHLTHHKLVKGSAVVFAGSVVVNALAYVFHLITGRMLGPQNYSILASLISLSYVIGFPATLISTIVTRKVSGLAARHDKKETKGFLLSMGKHVVLADLFIIGSFILLRQQIADFLHINEPFLIVILGVIFAGSLFMTVPGATLQGLLRFTSLAAIGVVSSLLRVISAYGAIIFGFGVAGVLYGMLASEIIVTIFSIMMLSSYFTVRAKHIPVRLARYTAQFWMITALLGKGLLINVDVLLVKHFFESHDAGLYAAMSTTGKIVLFFASSLSIVLLPIATQKHAKGKSAVKELLLAQGGIVLLSSAILLAYRIMPELVISLLYGREYFAIAPYLWLIGVYFLLYNMSYTFVNYFIAGKHTVILTMPLVISVFQIGGIILFHRSFYDVLSVMIGSASLLILVFTVYFYLYTRQQRRIEYKRSIDQ